MNVFFQQMPHAIGLELPAYATADAAGLDLRAAVQEEMILASGQRALVPTGLQMHLPQGYEAQIRPRSGLAYKNGITVLNAPGTIDADYRGEIQVLLINLGEAPFTITRGMRIAQMVIAAYQQISPTIDTSAVQEDQSARGMGGFGSTGVH